jgi:hypothetical protein
MDRTGISGYHNRAAITGGKPMRHAAGDVVMDRVCAALRARVRSIVGCALVAALGLSAAGCTTTTGNMSFASAGPASVAFESIDGAPPAVFRSLVQKLTDEAQARQMPVVSREGFAAYRVRAYLAASVEKKKKRAPVATIAWVWDVYDAQQARAFRISGEEAAPGASGDIWAAVDDAMLTRIAQKGMAQLADGLRAGDTPVAAPVEDSAPGRVAFAQ